MELKHIKLISGEDIIAYVQYNKVNTRNVYTIVNPITIYSDMEYGYVAKNWLSFSDTNTVPLYGKDVLFCNDVSSIAESFYHQFINRNEDTDESSNEETLIDTMIESKKAIKH